ncbi:PepSY domain-containing protein [Streptomyces griseoaurantiacus]|uniref:PepSY domain-containing protein n=1 Tax=Streptomyces griseoaurantiacus TaxID=68213 RepID=UPI0036EF447D
MKRNIVLAVVAAAVLAGGGTATALAVADDDGPGADDRVASAGRSGQDRADDAADDRDDDRGDGRHHDRHHDGRDDDGRDDDGREDDSAAASSAKVTAAEAIAAALRHTPGSVVSAELDDAVWSVEVLSSDDSWRDVRVDPGTGEVRGVRAEHEDAEDLAEERAALKGASTSAEEAARAAAAKGTVTSVELDERGWEAETLTSGGGERDWTVGLRGADVTAGHP